MPQNPYLVRWDGLCGVDIGLQRRQRVVMVARAAGVILRNNMTAMQNRFLTTAEVAKICDVDLKTIHNWVDKRHMPHFRTPGRHLRFKPAKAATKGAA